MDKELNKRFIYRRNHSSEEGNESQSEITIKDILDQIEKHDKLNTSHENIHTLLAELTLIVDNISPLRIIDLKSTSKTLDAISGICYEFGKLTQLALTSIDQGFTPIIIQFYSGEVATTFSYPDSLVELNEITITSNKHIEIQIINNRISSN